MKKYAVAMVVVAALVLAGTAFAKGTSRSGFNHVYEKPEDPRGKAGKRAATNRIKMTTKSNTNPYSGKIDAKTPKRSVSP